MLLLINLALVTLLTLTSMAMIYLLALISLGILRSLFLLLLPVTATVLAIQLWLINTNHGNTWQIPNKHMGGCYLSDNAAGRICVESERR